MMPGWLVLEIVEVFGDLVDAVEMGMESRGWRRVVEMDVEEKLLVGFGKAFPKFALDGAIARADVVLYHVTNDFAHIFHLS